MKPNLILCLALVLSGGFFNSAQANDQPDEKVNTSVSSSYSNAKLAPLAHNSQQTSEVAATQLDNDDLEVIKAANRNCQLELVDIAIDEASVGFGLFVEGYKGGKLTEFENHGGHSWSPSVKGATVKVCVCMEDEQPPKADWTTTVRGDHPFIPGTGSTRLGYAFRTVGKSGQGYSLVMNHADFDLWNARMVKCKDLPFTITRQNDKNPSRAVPVIAIFPAKFDLSSLKGDINASSLPDGTIVVYAAIKTAFSPAPVPTLNQDTHRKP